MDKKFEGIEFGALWMNKDGISLSGNMGKARVLMLPNKFKVEGDNKPDYRLFVVPSDKKEPGSDG